MPSEAASTAQVSYWGPVAFFHFCYLKVLGARGCSGPSEGPTRIPGVSHVPCFVWRITCPVFCAACSPELLPLDSGELEDDADKMHVDREFEAVTGGSGQWPVSRDSSPMVEDAKRQPGASVGPRELEVYTVSAMQTPCRCRNQYACYF